MLTRTFRLAASPLAADASSDNGLVEGCRQAGLAAIGELEVRVVGAPDETGYLVDITVLDRALRSTAPALFREALRAEFESGRPTDVPSLLRQIARTAQAQLVPSSHATLTELAYRPSPHRSVTIRLERPASADARIDKDPSIMLTDAHARAACALLTETFEFAASHRLHLAARSDADNRALFGKCNNPNGHGHNYRIEVAVAVGDGSAVDFARIQSVVQREIMARFDHKHLNLDCPEFRDVNPSVENIARVCYGLLAPVFAADGAELRCVRVWETEKTSCRFPAMIG
jgi:6-pyruvoyltetrahydropterin/6-carboxytetrahydropterin synthase